VDIMVLLNLELIARTTTNTAAKLSKILDMYGVSPKAQKQPAENTQPAK